MWLWNVETKKDGEGFKEREIEFEISDSWFQSIFERLFLGQETRGNVENKFYQTTQDFLDDYVVEDTDLIYYYAEKENQIIQINPLEDWSLC